MKPREAAERLDRKTFYQLVIRDGRAAAAAAYQDTDEYTIKKLAGSMEGFKIAETTDSIDELQQLFIQYHEESLVAFEGKDPEFWFYRGRECEVKWVLHCLAAYDFLIGGNVNVTPLRDAVHKAEELLGLRHAETEARTTRPKSVS